MTPRLPWARSRWASLVTVLAAVVLLVLGSAPPAQAHATVVSTDPAAGEVLPTAPDTVRLTFSEPVATVPDGVVVYDAASEVVATSATVDGDDLVVGLTGEVGQGTLVLTYRVVSKDGHPISGSLIFSVGAPSPTIQEPPRTETGTASVPATLSVVRGIGYVGLFLGAGLVWFAVLFLPADRATERATDRSRRRLVVGARAGGLAAGACWLLTLPMTAAYQSVEGYAALGRVSTWGALATSEYAVTAAVVLGLTLAVGLLGSGRATGRRGVAAVGAGVVATCAPALTGHTLAATPAALAIGADVLHLVAGSVWLGGLVGLALVLADLSARGTMAGEVLVRFSSVAAGVLVALVVAGTLLSWRILGSWSGLVDTTYGRLLLVKIAAGLVVVGLAAYNRFRLLPRLATATHRRDRREGAGLVARAVALEGSVLVVVLLVTGFLVDRNPAGTPTVPASASTRALTRTGTLDAIEAQATISRQTPGPATVTLELVDPAGNLTEGFASPVATLDSDDVAIGDVALRNNGPGVYEADVVIPSPGTWRLAITLQTSVSDTADVTLEFGILG